MLSIYGARGASGKRADPFYLSPAWRALRLQALRRDRWRCVICGADCILPGAARIDHITPRSTHPELALDLGNLRTLCAACDNQAHREKGSNAAGAGGQRIERFVIRGCRPDGTPLDPSHPWAKV